MEMQRCPNGHFYDPSKSSSCPYCTGPSANSNFTVPLSPGPNPAAGSPGPAAPAGGGGEAPGGIGLTVPVTPFSGNANDEKTIGLPRKKLGIDPVVGWLVCIEGADKGQDYRIHTGNNTIGRGETLDIFIRGDKSISREPNAIISFVPSTKTFYLRPGDGREIPLINEEPLFETTKLAGYDKLQIADTKLLFIPLCGEEFDWV